MVPWKNVHCGTEFCQPIPNQQSGCIQQTQSIQFSTMDPDFPISSFLGEETQKKTHSLPGKYTLSPDGCAGWWFNTIQTMKRPGSGVQFAGEISMVNSIILVAEFPVCFYQKNFWQLNPMFFRSEIPFCWVKPCDAPRNPKVDLHSTSAASSHRRSPKSNEFPSG